MKRFLTALAASAACLSAQVAHGEIVLSQLVVELKAGKSVRQDIEVLNKDPNRAYVVAEPREIVDPGTSIEKSFTDPDPGKLGLLVSPSRMVLEPGQHKLIRFADVAPSPERERVYRVTVKPVIGGLETDESGIKVLVGYDVLILVRPSKPEVKVSATRQGQKILWRNDGNVSVELTDGRQCRSATNDCSSLPGKRLYAGASWQVDVEPDGPIEYLVRSPTGNTKRRI
jgi:P pilus assembly chaperone PapD